jgi:hypothetical protein
MLDIESGNGQNSRKRAEHSYREAQDAFLSAMKSRDKKSIGTTARQLCAALEQVRRYRLDDAVEKYTFTS